MDVAPPDVNIDETNLDFDVTNCFLVFVSEVISPGEFWIQKVECTDELDSLMDGLW